MAGDNAEIATKYCATCKQDVPSANFDMHVVHCQRFLTPCPQCGESVNKKQLQEHIDENHAQVKCDACGENMEKMELDQHKSSSCQRRNVNCQYCEITLPACDIEEHKDSCGSRTEECENCKRRVLVKDLEDHISSGCQIPVKANGKERPKQDKTRVPERLIGGQDVTMAGIGGFGFAFHPQFKPRYPYSNEGIFNPYFPHSDSHNFEYLNDSPKASSPFSSKPSPTHVLTPSSQKSTSPFVNKRRQYSDRQSSFDVPSSRQTRDVHSMAGPDRMKGSDFTRQATNKYGIRSSDSDYSDSDTMEERRPFPDLTDDTFLPCEFCEELFPADSLGFHQANCDYVPPTPRPRSGSPPKLKRLSLNNYQSGASSMESYQDEAAALPSNGLPFRSSSPDIGEGSAPCEFCSSSFPLVNLALHQVTCPQNPNLQDSWTPERRRSPPPETKPRLVKSDLPKPELPILHPPQEMPIKSDPPRAIVRPSDGQTKSTTSSNTESATSSHNVQAREKRPLAPNFSVKATEPVPDKMAPTLPKNKSALNDTSTTEKKPRKKRKSKPIPRKNPAAVPRKFNEVNVLGGDNGSISRSPFEAQCSTPQTGFNSGSFSTSGPSSAAGTFNDHAANIKYLHQRNAQASRSEGVNRFTSPQNNPGGRKINHGLRGQNPGRGRNSTRGRPYGSSTVTIPRRDHNQRRVSGIQAAEGDMNSQPDLTLQGQPASEGRNRDLNGSSFNRRRGTGQRLGSGDSFTRPKRAFHPPRNNNYD